MSANRSPGLAGDTGLQIKLGLVTDFPISKGVTELHTCKYLRFLTFCSYGLNRKGPFISSFFSIRFRSCLTLQWHP